MSNLAIWAGVGLYGLATTLFVAAGGRWLNRGREDNGQ